ncbi:type I methionyl aminopeptidase [Myxococcota bacterium]|nr:type I methionyl aminopeptidase [Myxococcota bacterium]
MSIVLHGPADVERLRRAGACAAATLATIAARLAPGVTTAEIDRWVREDTAARGARPSQLGYDGFPAAVCVSRNHVVCHGVPSPHEALRDGDIVNVDVTSELDGFHGDTSATFTIGAPSDAARLVTDVARRALWAAIDVVRDGARLGELGAVIEALAARYGCGTVRELGGHGIGRAMHLPPHVPHHGRAGRGMRLRAGMAFTIEPMITIGEPALQTLDDGWTIVTADGTPSAQFEHTLIVTRDGCEILTASPLAELARP